MDGIINIYKEKGCTSHTVVAAVRKILNTKAGHTGTLDPEAQGVLPICIGLGTKIAGYLTEHDKQYKAEIIFGISTDTEDISGKVTHTRDFVYDSERIHLTAEHFTGVYMQTPPMYSAVKSNGQRLYKLAREGVTVERNKREVHIRSIEVLEHREHENKAVIRVLCSKGTYIRTLCSDIGELLGCGACMGELVRERSGRFSSDDAVTLDELRSLAASGLAETKIMPIDKALDYPKAVADKRMEKYLYNGNKIDFDYINTDLNPHSGDRMLVYDEDGILIGIYEYRADRTGNSSVFYIQPVTLLYRHK